MLTKFINAVIEYLQHDSTNQGLIILATAVGIHLDPSQAAAIGVLGGALLGLYKVFIQDRNVDKSVKPKT